MIYELNGQFIDLSKLERVSSIELFSYINYRFSYQINNENYYITPDRGYDSILKMRNDLISAWKQYHEKKG